MCSRKRVGCDLLAFVDCGPSAICDNLALFEGKAASVTKRTMNKKMQSG